ncbi:hypothetical protein N7539_003770 [Penicillium diatomitis]|uniref:Beta-lactamase-related domain-containing protein n=1 Tax=Penicillium diatomitis TaxID=2819901 RepID=A0A9W9XCI3_9EURO|nr:uncharacterized protein N7539_003770 [Penicillium diatomitis]KAJ5488880.1 hypothetical protein N7539_003770 [Penicillium diatomitis]
MSTSSEEPENWDSVNDRLELAWLDVEAALKIADSPSIAVGIIHGAKPMPVFQKSSGIANFDTGQCAAFDTVYNIAGCSQMITCAAVGILVNEKRLAWNDLVRKHIPSFCPFTDSDIGEKASVIDLCRHTTGLANPAPIFMGPGGSSLSKADEHTAFVNSLPGTDEQGPRFRKVWQHSDAAFGLLALIIEKVAEMPFHEFLRERIFKPLRMWSTNVMPDECNGRLQFAVPYVKSSAGIWLKVQAATLDRTHGPLLASTGMTSSVLDMLKFMQAVIHRYDQESDTDSTQPMAKLKIENPLREIAAIWKNAWERPVKDGLDKKTGYTLGWNRTTIPSAVFEPDSYDRYADGEKSYINPRTIVGKGSDSPMVYGYHGITDGFVSATYLFPETRTAIVAMSNSASTGDVAEAAVRIMLQALFRPKPRVSAFGPLRAAGRRCEHVFEKMLADWKTGRDTSLFNSDLQDFAGSYVGLNTIRISITGGVKEGESGFTELMVTFGANSGSKHPLEPYNTDMLSFLPQKREQLLARGMMMWNHYKMGIFEFVREKESGKVLGFWWQWDANETSSLWVKDHGVISPQEIQEIQEKIRHSRIPEEKVTPPENGTVNSNADPDVQQVQPS